MSSKILRTDRVETAAIHDTELELDILAIIAFDSKAQYRITQLGEDDFYSLDTKKIYNAFFKIFSESSVIDLSIIDDKKIAILISNRQNVVIPAKLKAKIRKLKEISGKRKIQSIAYELTAMVSSGKALGEIREYGSKIIQVSEDTLKDITTEIVDDKLEEYMTRHRDPSIKTGFPKLDKTTGGFLVGTLNIVAAAQGVGKTTFVINLLNYVCGKLNKKVLFVSMEMNFMSLHAKAVSNLSGVPYSRMMFDMKQIETEEWKKINDARAEIFRHFVYRLGEREISTNDIRAKINALQDVELVIIDYMQLVKPMNKGVNMYEIITNISRELRILASETNIPFVVIAAINRDYADRGDSRPHIADIRGSGNIEFDADMVLLLHRASAFRSYDKNKDRDCKDEYEFTHKADITIAKNRFGESNLRIELFFDGEKSLIREMARWN